MPDCGTSFRVTLFDAVGRVLYELQVADTAVAIPDSVTIVPARSYLWKVEARTGWDRWNRRSAPAPAPLPLYQRQYSRGRYPRVEQQQALHRQNYRYQPRDAIVRQHYQEQAVQRAPAPSQRGPQGAPPQERSPRQHDIQRSNSPPALHQDRGR